MPETERLALRQLTLADLDTLYRLDSDPEVMRYIIPPRTYEGTREYLEELIANYEKFPGLGRWAVIEKSTGAFVGVHVLKHLEASGYIEIGYRFFPEFWGRGYATEMTRALLRYGFQDLGLQQIVGVTHPENLASQHVLEKCGLRYQHMAEFYGGPVRFYTLEQPAPAPQSAIGAS
ncbi:GNAT family N-acetyltransferase [Hymenobacter oligotrophus]|uniref:GNAT family N-acetyltransferase n=1 Tax=Hymenobacter oligotrophus TaxID=2319843 RepID=UPI0013C3123A|nr:GNAT family N-acetyltransferase [Hymenobacter oligotrophus]